MQLQEKVGTRRALVAGKAILVALLLVQAAGCSGHKTPIAGLYVNTRGAHPSLLLLLPTGRYVHCVYRQTTRRYIEQGGRWFWYHVNHRMTFTNFVFYFGDDTIGMRRGQPGQKTGDWAAIFSRATSGRGRFLIDVDARDRYFVWRCTAGAARGIAAAEAALNPPGARQAGRQR